ncbi:MAG TPA: hypothetical protein VGP47_03215 [Parachlamydiaceae bacterium]|nr:hypothetical protein [Parachlamydiaceae bacterium]
MGAGHVSKDSWSRCETPSMLYGAVHNPSDTQAQKTSASSGLSKDTIESTQQRLKREIITKLDNKGLELPHESYVAVVQVGKYVFLAIMLPVYLCCYGIPRWFMINAISPMFEGIKNQALNVGRFIVEMSKHVTDLMKGLLEQLIGDALRLSKERGKNLWRHVTKKFGPISKKMAGISNSIKAALNKIKGNISKGSEKVLERAHYQSKSTNQWIAKNSLRIGKKVGSKALSLLQRFDRAVFTPFMKVVAAPFIAMFIGLSAVKKYLVKGFNSIRSFLKKVISPVVEVTKKIIKYSSEKIKSTFQPTLVFLSRCKENLFTSLRELNRAFLQPAFRMLAHSKTFASPLLKPIKKVLLITYSAYKGIIKFSHKWIPKRNKEKKKKKHSFFHIDNPFKPMLKSVKGFFQITAKIASGIINAFIFVSKALVQFFKLLKVFPQTAIHYLSVFLKGLAFIATRAAFVVHVVIAVFWMSSVYGFHLAKQISDPLVKAPQK